MDQAHNSRMRSTRRRDYEPPLPEPLADFLTWPTYGTWLPGDERVGRVPPRLATSRSRSQTRGAGPPDGRCLPSRPGPRRLVELTIAGCGGGLSTPSIAARTMCTSSWRATANPRRSGSSSKPGAPAGSRRCSRNVSVPSPHRIPRPRRFARTGGLSVEAHSMSTTRKALRRSSTTYARHKICRSTLTRRAREEPVVMLSIVQGRPSATRT